MSFTVELNDLSLEYKVFGSGKKHVICFHGFAREANDFLVFENLYGKDFTFISINFFLHGKSTFDEVNRVKRHPITKYEWLKIIKKLMAIFELEKAIFMGYSMGGRLILTLLEIAPQIVESLFLIAPDGIKLNPWYRFSSKTAIGRNAFKLAVKNPNALFPLALSLVKIGVLPKKVVKLAQDNFSTENQRNLVYKTWTASRLLLPNLDLVKQNIAKHNIKYQLIFGKYDKFIRLPLAQIFMKDIEAFGQLKVVNFGHVLLIDKVVEIIKAENLL